jgi:hypothetical protein
MTERVCRDKNEKFTLISTTIKDISDFNDLFLGFDGSRDYRTEIASAHRTCVGFAMQGWSTISKDALSACDKWDALKLVPANSFLLLDVYEPLNLKLAALRTMVNNFSVHPSDDDNHYWTFVNDQLTISDAADENPVYGHSLNPNPFREDDTHNGNEGNPHHDALVAMLSQLEHYI